MAVYLGSQLKTLNGGIPISGGSTPTGTIEISANGTYNVAAFAQASVNVSGSDEDLLAKNLDFTLSGAYTYNGASLKANAFYNCSLLTSINCPSCTSIGSNALYNCKSLASASFPVCTSIGSSAFAYCSTLTSANFPACITIWSNAFYSCKSLTSVDFSSCKTIRSSAFAYCYALASINFPECTTIESIAFGYCSALTSVNFPACTTIGSNAFGYCSTLAVASFSSCNIIYMYAFRNCISLESLYLLSTSVCTLSSTNVFMSTPMSLSTYLGYFGSIYVPSSLLFNYQTAKNWSVYSSRFVGV